MTCGYIPYLVLVCTFLQCFTKIIVKTTLLKTAYIFILHRQSEYSRREGLNLEPFSSIKLTTLPSYGDRIQLQVKV